MLCILGSSSWQPIFIIGLYSIVWSQVVWDCNTRLQITSNTPSKARYGGVRDQGLQPVLVIEKVSADENPIRSFKALHLRVLIITQINMEDDQNWNNLLTFHSMREMIRHNPLSLLKSLKTGFTFFPIWIYILHPWFVTLDIIVKGKFPVHKIPHGKKKACFWF